MLQFLLTCLEVLLLFNLLILVHELGHFLAARWRGLVVEKFAIWFGKPLWSRTIGGVEYRLGCIPAGGFVAIPQLAPMEALEGESRLAREKLPPASPIDKIIVAAAGPLFSLGLAFVMAVMVWGVGKPESEYDATVIGYVQPGGPAEKAGLRPGDVVLAVDGKPVRKFLSGTDSIKWRIVRSEGETIAFRIRRDGQEMTIESGWRKPELPGWRRPALREVGIGPFRPPGIGFIVPGSPGARAGLRPGDLITEAAGQPVSQLDELAELLERHLGKPLALTIRRGSDTLALTLEIPEAPKPGELPELGIAWGRITFSHPNPFRQVADAATSIFRMLDALFSPRSDVKAAHFSGPVGIMRLYYQVFETDYGWRLALSLSVLINVNLALLNLLPFPVLDGGHIVLALIEAIRRKPLNVKILEAVQTAAALLLIAFMLYVTFFDIGDFFARQDKPAATPPPAPTPSPP